MLDFDGEGRLRPLVYEGTTAEDRKRFEARLYLRYKYNLSHYLRFYRDMSKSWNCPSNCRSTSPASWASLAQLHGSRFRDQRGTGAHFRKHANLPSTNGQSTVDAANAMVAGLLKVRPGSGKKGGEKVEISEK